MDQKLTNEDIYKLVGELLRGVVLPKGETTDNFLFVAFQESDNGVYMHGGGSEAGLATSLTLLGTQKSVMANAIKSATVLLVDQKDPILASKLNFLLEKTKQASQECNCPACRARRKNQEQAKNNSNVN